MSIAISPFLRLFLRLPCVLVPSSSVGIVLCRFIFCFGSFRFYSFYFVSFPTPFVVMSFRSLFSFFLFQFFAARDSCFQETMRDYTGREGHGTGYEDVQVGFYRVRMFCLHFSAFFGRYYCRCLYQQQVSLLSDPVMPPGATVGIYIKNRFPSSLTQTCPQVLL